MAATNDRTLLCGAHVLAARTTAASPPACANLTAAAVQAWDKAEELAARLAQADSAVTEVEQLRAEMTRPTKAAADPEELAALPTPATHSILTVLKAGETS